MRWYAPYLFTLDTIIFLSTLGFIAFLWPARSYWAFKPWLFKLGCMAFAFGWFLIGDILRLSNVEEVSWIWEEPLRPVIVRSFLAFGLSISYIWLKAERRKMRL